MKKFLLIFISVVLFFNGATAMADDNTSWKDLNPPQWLSDVRRTEIITFGSLPFVTLWTTVGYSVAVYGKFRNPMDKSTSSFTEDDQFNIIKISAATCIGLGLFDLTYTLIKRAIVKKRGVKKAEQQIEVLPFSVIQQNEADMELNPQISLPEYFECGVQSAIF